MNAPILITGAGGCIGAWVLTLLRHTDIPAVAFDLSDNQRRVTLLREDPDEPDPTLIAWETGDIADADRVAAVFAKHKPEAVIHLAALQVPFCRADPAAGARANVLGTINMMECAANAKIKRFTYASSVAATAMDSEEWLETLYGAFKVCNEQTARVYWQERQLPSIGIRPSVVYGPGRDQGMSAGPTLAMLAAVRGMKYDIPFTGPAGLVHAREAASAFLQAIARPGNGAHVFDLNGIVKTSEEVAAMIRARIADAEIGCVGSPLPFPSALSDTPLREHIGKYHYPAFEDGLDDTLEFFTRRIEQNRLHEITGGKE